MTQTGPAAPSPSDTTVDHSADRAAITQIVRDVEAGLNANDPEPTTRHFAEDAVAVGVDGRRTAGRSALVEAHVAALGGFLRGQYARYDIVGITFVRPDVALLHKQARAADEAGNPLGEAPVMAALYVLVKERGRWWIAARQNTPIPVRP
jgi:uncharacterized protein (TIGR02246 family)